MILEQRFWSKVEILGSDDCWEWQGSIRPNGYGQINVNGIPRRAHRISWELAHGLISAGNGTHGTCICHKCDNRKCVNPAHLFLGSQRDNIVDMYRKGRRGIGLQPNLAKLNSAQIRVIKKCRMIGISVRFLGSLFGVSHPTVSKWSEAEASK